MGNATSRDGWLTIAVECLPGGGVITSPFHFAAGNSAHGALALSTGVVGCVFVGAGAVGGASGIVARAAGYKVLEGSLVQGAARGAVQAVAVGVGGAIAARTLPRSDEKPPTKQELDKYREDLQNMLARNSFDLAKIKLILKTLKALRPFEVFHLGNSLVKRMAYPMPRNQPTTYYSCLRCG